MAGFRIPANLVLLLMILAGGGAEASIHRVITQQAPVETCFRATREDVLSTVKSAVQLLSDRGPEHALRRFMSPGSGYLKGDLYVFVLTRSGLLVANGANPRSVGNDILLLQDNSGHYFVKSLLRETAARGDAWVDYFWLSPCTRKISAKSVYCESAGSLVVCAGYYRDIGAANANTRH